MQRFSKRSYSDEELTESFASRLGRRSRVASTISKFTKEFEKDSYFKSKHFQIVHPKNPSERSYQGQLTMDQIKTGFINLSYHFLWMFFIVACNNIIYFINTYLIIFNPHTGHRATFNAIIVMCYVFLYMDFFIHVTHRYTYRRINMAPYVPMKLYILIPYFVMLFIPIVGKYFRESILILETEVLISMLRCIIKTFQYFRVITKSAASTNFIKHVSKYSLILYLILQTFVCFWRYYCEYCDHERSAGNHYTWYNHTLIKVLEYGMPAVLGFPNATVVLTRLTPWEYYLVCIYYACGALTGAGYGGASYMNDTEQLIIVILSISSIILLNGCFQGAYAGIKFDHYKVYYKFLRKNTLIKNQLIKWNAPYHLQHDIKLYYMKFLRQQFGQMEPLLFQHLPRALKSEIYLDKYWFFFMKSYIFKYASEPMKRQIVIHMKTAIFNTGEVIYAVGENKSLMFFVAKGAVSILSSEDSETPLVCFGAGTCFGSFNIIHTSIAKFEVRAATYCVIQFMYKSHFWEMMSGQCRSPSYTKALHTTVDRRIERAKTNKKFQLKYKIPHTMLGEVKSLMPKEENIWKNWNFNDGALYYRSKLANMRLKDKVFIKTKWPWKFQLRSDLKKYWNFFILSLVVIVGIFYPYCLCYDTRHSFFFTLLEMTVTVIFPIDLIVDILTVIEKEGEVVVQHRKIMETKLKTWGFYFDVIAALPFSVIYLFSNYWTEWTVNRKLLQITQFNCVFKCIKIPIFLIDIEKTYTGHVAVPRMIKHVLYLVFFNYVITCLYYMIFCNENCNEYSYIGIKWGHFKPISKFFSIYYYALSIITHTDFAGFGTKQEMYIGMIISVIGFFIHNFILADIKATLELNNYDKNKYCAHIDNLMSYMEGQQACKNTKKRVIEFLTFHWIYFNGVHEDVLFKDLSNKLLLEQKILRFMKLMYKVPLFVHLEREVLNKLLIRIETIFVPPNELIVYEGQIIRDIFVIEKGSVEMFCLSSKNRMKVLRRGDSFCLLEMLMEKPSYFTYRSCTHCAIVKLSRKKIVKEVFAQYAGLREQLESIISEMEETLPVKRLFKKSARLTNIEDVIVENEDSFFIFSKHKRHPLFKDYYQNMRNKFQKRVCRYLLMRRTITPNGSFLLTYEKINVLLRILLNIYMPLSHFYRANWQPIFYLSFILDIQAVLDMYLRLHVGYYNSKGILVAHPIYTASHYLKTSFIIDLLAMFPIEKIFDMDQRLFGGNKYDYLKFLCSFNRILSLYRYNGLYFTKNVFSSITLLGIVLYSSPLMFIGYNYLTTFCMYLSCEMTTNWNGTIIAPLKERWLYKPEYGKNPIIHMHITSAYWITFSLFNIAVTGISGVNLNNDVIFNTLCLLIGYFGNTFLMAWMSSQAKINRNLTENQIKGNDLKKFLQGHKIPKPIKNEIHAYFELNWSRTQGVYAVSTIQLCHDALKEDFIIRFYRHILYQSPIFHNVGSGVARVLGEHLNEQYFHANSIIIEYNDVLSNVFILRKGVIEVMDSSGKLIVLLTVGSIFGHIDRCSYTRSMVKVVAATQVDLWTINTEFMYELLDEVEGVVQKLEKHIIGQSLSYIEGIKDPSNTALVDLYDDSSAQYQWFKWQKVIKAITCLRTEWIFTTLIYVSIYWLFYVMAFAGGTKVDMIVFYIFDAIFLLQIIRELLMSHNNKYGEKLDVKISMKNYLKKTFPHKILCIIPFEIIYFIFYTKHDFIGDILIMNRCGKLLTVHEFFIRHYSNININVLLMNSILIVAEMTLFIHVSACLLYYIKCPVAMCDENWTERLHPLGKIHLCDNEYICSIYYATSIFTHNGFPDWIPGSVMERIVCIVVAFISQILLNVVVGQMHTVIKYFTIIRLNFDYNRRNLASFLHFSHISRGLERKILIYVEWLWIYRNGKQLPEFFNKMPSNLKIDCKMRIYGYHVYNHPCFMDCHADFLRQLVEKIEVEVYFAGNTICFQGEINDKMYFIHSGIVVVLENNEAKNEIVTVDELWKGDTFGTVQGLFRCQAHNYTFRAKIRSTILTLTKHEWVHLLHFFPASKYSIYDHFVINANNDDT